RFRTRAWARRSTTACNAPRRRARETPAPDALRDRKSPAQRAILAGYPRHDRARLMNIVETPPKSLVKPLAADLIARFVAIVGEKHAITDPQAQAPYLLEMRDMFRR